LLKEVERKYRPFLLRKFSRKILFSGKFFFEPLAPILPIDTIPCDDGELLPSEFRFSHDPFWRENIIE